MQGGVPTATDEAGHQEERKGRNEWEEDGGAPPPPSSRPRGLPTAARATARSGGGAGRGGSVGCWGFARAAPRDDAGDVFSVFKNLRIEMYKYNYNF